MGKGVILNPVVPDQAPRIWKTESNGKAKLEDRLPGAERERRLLTKGREGIGRLSGRRDKEEIHSGERLERGRMVSTKAKNKDKIRGLGKKEKGLTLL